VAPGARGTQPRPAACRVLLFCQVIGAGPLCLFHFGAAPWPLPSSLEKAAACRAAPEPPPPPPNINFFPPPLTRTPALRRQVEHAAPLPPEPLPGRRAPPLRAVPAITKPTPIISNACLASPGLCAPYPGRLLIEGKCVRQHRGALIGRGGGQGLLRSWCAPARALITTSPAEERAPSRAVERLYGGSPTP
jgi:hypothetical protein